MYEKCFYSRVPNNRRGWNIRGRGGGLDIVIIFSNRGGWNNTGGLDGVEKIIIRDSRVLFIKFTFLYKNGVPEKIKTHLPQQLPGLQQLFNPDLSNFIPKIVSPIPILKSGQKLQSISEITKERQLCYYNSI